MLMRFLIWSLASILRRPRWPLSSGVQWRAAHGYVALGTDTFMVRDKTAASKLINARGETVAQKPSFRDAYKHRRCLVPVDGFYEWRKEGEGKQPFHRFQGETVRFVCGAVGKLDWFPPTRKMPAR